MIPDTAPAADNSLPAVTTSRRWGTGLLGAVLVAALTGATVWFVMKPVYTATAILRVATPADKLLGDPQRNDAHWIEAFRLYQRTQHQLLKSKFVITSALRKSELTDLPLLQHQPDPIQWVADHLKVTFPGDAEIMEISLSAGDPQGLDQLLNSVIESYLQEVVEAARGNSMARLNELELACTKLETELRTKRTELRQFTERIGDSGVASTDVELLRIQTQSRQELWERLDQEVMRTKVELQRELKQNASQITMLSSAQPAQEANAQIRLLATGGAAGAMFLVVFLVVAGRSRHPS